jgi:hypothetical protein
MRIEFVQPKKRYGFFHLLFDFILVFATGGLWLIWLLVRFLRNGSR